MTTSIFSDYKVHSGEEAGKQMNRDCESIS